MKCTLTRNEKVVAEVRLLEVRKTELEWLKFERYFIIQDSNFKNEFLRLKTWIKKIKGVVLQER